MNPISLKPINVFTPNDYPRYTYVNRTVRPPLESRLQEALDTPKEVISISGPSKSGKTVLIERMVSTDNLISVSGSEIKSDVGLWDRVLDWMGAPSSRTVSTSDALMGGKNAQITGSAGVPLMAGGSIIAGTQSSDTNTKGGSTTHNRGGLAQVQREIGNSAYCVLVDDFHYIPRDIQVEVGRQIKTAAERGIRIIVASVPHRSDDVVRSNSELRGRTQNIDTEFWKKDELLKIAQLGFETLNMIVDETVLHSAAQNACGSPQIMQRICLNICSHLSVHEGYKATRYVSSGEINLREILALTSTSADYKTLLTTLHHGPKTRGTERAKYMFIDGSHGDVYRCILLAVQQDPPLMELPYDVLMDRVKSVCIGSSPGGRGVTEACTQISEFAAVDRTVEFDKDADVQTFYIADPYWIFYLRCSPKIVDLAKEWHTNPSGTAPSA